MPKKLESPDFTERFHLIFLVSSCFSISLWKVFSSAFEWLSHSVVPMQAG